MVLLLGLYLAGEDPSQGDHGCWFSAVSLGAMPLASWPVKRIGCSGGSIGIGATWTWVGVSILSLPSVTYFFRGNIGIK